MNAPTLAGRMADFARGKAEARGIVLPPEVAEVLRGWVRELEAAGIPEYAIPELVERLVHAMMSDERMMGDRSYGEVLGMSEFYAALDFLRDTGALPPSMRPAGDPRIRSAPASPPPNILRRAIDKLRDLPGTLGKRYSSRIPETSAPVGKGVDAGYDYGGGMGGEGMGGGARREERSARWPGKEVEGYTGDGLETSEPPREGPTAMQPAAANGDPVAGSAPGDEVTAEPSPDAARRPPPRSAYALLEAPETVVAKAELEVAIGLAEKQSAGVVGEALVLPESTVYPYVLTMQLIAEGFEVTDGGSWRRDATATEEEPYPRVTVGLRALEQDEAVRPRLIQLLYSIGGQTIGLAVRPIAVLRTSADHPPAPPPEAPAVDISVPTESVAPDLTIRILRDRAVAGGLLWTLESPHFGVADSPDPVRTDIGTDPASFAKELVQKVNLQEGKPGLALLLNGLAKTIAEEVPDEVWTAFHAAAAAAGGPPSVLVLSEEPHVPWELARVPNPLPDPLAPPFLGAQSTLGRWVLRQRSPKLPPPHQLEVERMAVVWGVYDLPKWKRLEAAEAEAAELAQAYGAVSIDARMDPVLGCLSGDPPADALHFAVHGLYNPGGIQEGLVLADDQYINHFQVSGGELAERPLVFLNACQVGSGQAILGDYAGMSHAFLTAGASAVVAPLWSVKDTFAKQIALDFYRDAFGGEPAASVLRRARAAYAKQSPALSATCLAYQFFGHPELRLRRPAPSLGE